MYRGITTSKSSALSMSALLILKMQETNGVLFIKANFLSYIIPLGFITTIFPFTTIYASLKSINLIVALMI